MEKSELVIEKEMFLEQIEKMHPSFYKKMMIDRMKQKDMIEYLKKDIIRIKELESILPE